MPLIFVDGCEDLSSWAGLTTTTIAAGRTGNGLAIAGTTGSAGYRIPAALTSDTITMGFAWRTTAPSSSDANPHPLTLWGDGGTTAHTYLRVNTDGSITALRSSTVLGTSATGLIVANTWCYIEVQVKLGESPNGAITVRVNGVPVIAVTNVDTKNSGVAAVYDAITFGRGTTGTNNVDDVYVMTGAGDAFLGDCQVETLYPNGNGTVNQWVGTDANSTDNYLLVDEVGIDIADYVGSSTPGQQDLYTLTNPVMRTGSILAVCHQSVVGRSDAAVTTFKQVNRGAVDTKLTQTLQTTLTGYQYCLTTNPETGAAWQYTDVDGLQSGVEIS